MSALPSGAPARKVLLTGLGQCSALGVGVEELWKALVSVRSGLRKLEMEGLVGQGLGAPLAIPAELAPGGRLRWALRETIGQALGDARLAAPEQRRAMAVIAATNFGGQEETIDQGEFLHPLRAVLSEFDCDGELWGISTACASGGGALGIAADLIRHEGLKQALVVAFDVITPYNYGGLASLRALTLETIRPFDRSRSGTLLGEGVGALVVESEQSASARGVEPYCELLGYGISNDGYHFTAPEPSGIGIRTAMAQALQESALAPSAIDHLNAHGTGTPHNDLIESQAVSAVCGAAAVCLPTTSIKPAVGHTMGAAGAIEGIATVLSLRDGLIPPTLNLDERDPECTLDYVVDEARRAPLQTAMCNSYGLWGCNVSVLFGRPRAGSGRESGEES